MNYDADIFNGLSINYHFKTFKINNKSNNNRSQCACCKERKKNKSHCLFVLRLGVLIHWQRLLLIVIRT